MRVEIQFGKTLPGPEDPTADQTPRVVDGIYVECQYNGYLDPADCREWAARLNKAAADLENPPKPPAEAPPPVPEPVEEVVEESVPKKKGK